MAAKQAGAFFLGFASGALALALVLWIGGGLHTSGMRAQEKPLPAAANPLSIGEAAREATPTLNPPISALPQDLGQADAKDAQPAARQNADQPDNITADSSLHLALPIAGINPNSLTDTFADARNGHPHEALDIPAPRGTPVLAAAEGNVVKLFTSKPGGLTVYQFDDSRRYCFYYAHLDRYANGLREGVLVRPGDVIGYVGTTGNAPPNAPHLHFAVFRLGPEKKWYHGTAIDPLPLIRGR